MNIASVTNDGPCTSGLEDIHLINDSVPELDLADISTRVAFLGKNLSSPIIINALTGGTEEARSINLELAKLARKYDLAMAVGSQMIAIENSALKDTFNVVREANPDGVIVANLSAMAGLREAREAVNMVAADAIQLHFNVPQELAMSEGERCFKGILDNVARIVDTVPVPVIAKEVGFGFSREAVTKLFGAGVRIFDIAGKGGTNFVVIEDQRQGRFQGELDEWGISTASSLAEILALELPVTSIASGGIRQAGDAVKALAMGADLVGIAAPFLKALVSGGPELLQKQFENLFYRLKAIFLLTGSKNCQELRTRPVVITGKTAAWLRARGIDPHRWSSRG